jgi:hypothetical protein
VPAICVGSVAALPPMEDDIKNPAVLKVVAQVFEALQLLPAGQHWRAFEAG